MDLAELIQHHDELQRKFEPVGRAPQDIDDGEELIQFFKDMHIALCDEMFEMMKEVGWKPWATSRHLNIEEVRGELIDALHFWLNLWMATFSSLATPEYMAGVLDDGYMRKNAVNAERQEQDYDGVTGKCPECHRDWPTLLSQMVTLMNPKLPLTAVKVTCPCGHRLTLEEREWLDQRLS